MSSDGVRRISDVTFGSGVRIMDFVNLYRCAIGDETSIGPFVEVQEDVRIGRRCKVESHSFVCAGTVIEDRVFVGHHVTFTNDRHPTATTPDGELKREGDWRSEPAVVEEGASIGSGAVILPGIRIGRGALVGAGSVVTRDVAPGTVVAGNPARPVRERPSVTGCPLFDPAAEHSEVGADIDAAISRVVRSGRFIGGPEIEAFEEEFSTALVEARPVAAVGSGTEAIRLALAALDIGPGDEVVVPANTFTATVMAVEAVGATPVIADVDPRLHVLTPATVEPVLTPDTRVVLPVHLYGHPAPVDELTRLAEARGIALLEDAAQGHGATLHGRPVGVWGRAAAFSFYPSKNLGAYGDAGAVAGDPEIVERVRRERDLGRDPSGAHVVPGTNSRLDAIQAAILRAKLPHLPRWVRARRSLAERYRELLADLPVGLPDEASWAAHAFHLFVVRVPDRDRVRRSLAEAAVETGVHYPVPVHLQPAHAGRVKVPRGAPVAERLAGEILSLPLYPQLSAEQQDRVARALRRALGRSE